MTNELQEARLLAALAGLTVPPEREETLAGGLAITKRIAASLAAANLGTVEPATQFRAPSSRDQ